MREFSEIKEGEIYTLNIGCKTMYAIRGTGARGRGDSVFSSEEGATEYKKQKAILDEKNEEYRKERDKRLKKREEEEEEKRQLYELQYLSGKNRY